MPCELPVQRTIKRAEMWAFYQALRNATLPCTIHTDHQGIVDGIRRGKQWCLSAKRPHADVWRRIWAKLEDLDFTEEQVQHVRAHRTKAAMRAMEAEDRRIAEGNEAVDMLAKEGANLDAGFGKEQALQTLGRKSPLGAAQPGLVAHRSGRVGRRGGQIRAGPPRRAQAAVPPDHRAHAGRGGPPAALHGVWEDGFPPRHQTEALAVRVHAAPLGTSQGSQLRRSSRRRTG